MTAHAYDTIPPVTPARPARRADAGSIRLSQRDIDGLILAGEHYGVPLDLLAAALRTGQDRLPAINHPGAPFHPDLSPLPASSCTSAPGTPANTAGPATRSGITRL